eukprot:TRINITY_DN70677_c0_g1_i1.p1 TRINITY_DN70677_c0_g1~~TRINITY_DN70677_c0_g1_i1.p1  ORF type:complete len:1200 (+),score=344.22 TRINITY_DN70677_c0_g1_i1:116-3601(+)
MPAGIEAVARRHFQDWFRAMDDGTVHKWAERTLTADHVQTSSLAWGMHAEFRGRDGFCLHYNDIVSRVWGGPGAPVTWAIESFSIKGPLEVQAVLHLSHVDSPHKPRWLQLRGRSRRLINDVRYTPEGQAYYTRTRVCLPVIADSATEGLPAWFSEVLQMLFQALQLGNPADWADCSLAESAACSLAAPGQELPRSEWERGRAGGALMLGDLTALCGSDWELHQCGPPDAAGRVKATCTARGYGGHPARSAVWTLAQCGGQVTTLAVELEPLTSPREPDQPPPLLSGFSDEGIGSALTEPAAEPARELARRFVDGAMQAMHAGTFGAFIGANVADGAVVTVCEHSSASSAPARSVSGGREIIIEAYNDRVRGLWADGATDMQVHFRSFEDRGGAAARLYAVQQVKGGPEGRLKMVEVEFLDLEFSGERVRSYALQRASLHQDAPVPAPGADENVCVFVRMLMDTLGRAMHEGKFGDWCETVCTEDVNFSLNFEGSLKEATVGRANMWQTYNAIQSKKELIMPGATLQWSWAELPSQVGEGRFHAERDMLICIPDNPWAAGMAMRKRHVADVALRGCQVSDVAILLRDDTAGRGPQGLRRPPPDVPPGEAGRSTAPAEDTPAGVAQAMARALRLHGPHGALHALDISVTATYQPPLGQQVVATTFQEVVSLMQALPPYAGCITAWEAFVEITPGVVRHLWAGWDACAAHEPHTRKCCQVELTVCGMKVLAVAATAATITHHGLSPTAGLVLMRCLPAAQWTGSIAQLGEAFMSADVVVSVVDRAHDPHGAVKGGACTGVRDLCLRYNRVIASIGAVLGAPVKLEIQEQGHFTAHNTCGWQFRMTAGGQQGGAPGLEEIHEVRWRFEQGRAVSMQLDIRPQHPKRAPLPPPHEAAQEVAVQIARSCLLPAADADAAWSSALGDEALCAAAPAQGTAPARGAGVAARGRGSVVVSALCALLGATERLAWRIQSARPLQDSPRRGAPAVVEPQRVIVRADNTELQNPGMWWSPDEKESRQSVVLDVGFAPGAPQRVALLSAVVLPPASAPDAEGAAAAVPAFDAVHRTGGAATPQVTAQHSGPLGEAPCRHNTWDSARIKRGWNILRCRQCEVQWRLDHQVFLAESCATFDGHGGCLAGADCDKLHVWRRKLKEGERHGAAQGCV